MDAVQTRKECATVLREIAERVESGDVSDLILSYRAKDDDNVYGTAINMSGEDAKIAAVAKAAMALGIKMLGQPKSED